ncbi:MAG: hypothetical protein HC857_02195 [Synechococcales cyanobacterium RU_4_20]|nr:hypothetical protein [Synechococcales cyanobacterium RU_4_20]
MDRDELISRFEMISFELVGGEASLFSYSPGFSDLCIRVIKHERHFLLKFHEVFAAKSSTSCWRFNQLKINKILTSEVNETIGMYHFSDSSDLDITCEIAGCLEIIDGHLVV